MRLFKLSQVTALTAALLLGTSAYAQQIQERTIRIGHPVNSDHPISFGVKKFSDIVSAKSGGKLKVREFP
ncbi:MAG: hypothetical protein RLZZ555_658, partial [Pseudomonadota bacterium]